MLTGTLRIICVLLPRKFPSGTASMASSQRQQLMQFSKTDSLFVILLLTQRTAAAADGCLVFQDASH